MNIDYIKDTIENNSIARQVLNVDFLQKNFPPRYEINSKIIYLNEYFNVQSITNKQSSAINIPIIEICKSNKLDELDKYIADHFCSLEELMLCSLLDSLVPIKIPTLPLVDCIDHGKKEIYNNELHPKNVLLSKPLFDMLCSKLYLLPFSKIFTLPVKNILYNNFTIFPISCKENNLVIVLSAPLYIGCLTIQNKLYMIEDNVIENIGMFICNEEAVSFSHIDKFDMNRIMSSSGGYCKRCKSFDEYSPIADDGSCICYSCFKPY